MAPHRNWITSLLLLISAASAWAQAPNPPSASQPAPIPPTTTLEKLVNPVGLSEPSPYGWHPDFIGPLRGVFDVSIGSKFWDDRFQIRDFMFGGSVDLCPGVRVRANFLRKDYTDRAFEINPDEIYLEVFNQYRARDWSAGASLRFGHVRYLHFPYPDAISQFDQVPGIADLTQRVETDYRSVVFVAEASTNGGWGVHTSDRAAGFDVTPKFCVMEAYGFYRSNFGRGWRFEARAGGIAQRIEPLGRGAELGGDVYIGKQLGEFNVGLLYENKKVEHEYTGIMVQFRPGPVTRALGRYEVDYSRTPNGFSVQVPLLHERLNESRFVRSHDVLVGEVRAVRIRTLWQAGVPRNEYEHRLESWGETMDPRLHCVVVEEPWYLQTEALVSPHVVPDSAWERDRQGPAQFVQRVTYRYYRTGPNHAVASGAITSVNTARLPGDANGDIR
jgi:hypothetical protein